MPRQGLKGITSILTPKLNTADAAARVWFATEEEAILPNAARTFARVMLFTSSRPHRGSRWRSTRYAACLQLLFRFRAHSSR